MKKVKSFRLVIVIALLALGAFIGAQNIYAQDMVGYFDDKLADGEYTIYTDYAESLASDSSLSNYLSETVGGVQEYWNSQDDWSSLNVSSTCSLDDMICDVFLYRHKPSSSELIKTYEDINIIIDSNIDTYFPMVNNNTVEVNYDESLFSSDEEKENYLWDYFSRFNEYDGSRSVSYRYDSYHNSLYRMESENDIRTRFLWKRVDNVVFNFVEEPYSDAFKRLTSGTLTVKSDVEIDKDLLNEYIWNYGSFSVEGNMNNNKAMIKLSNYENGHEVSERHLVTIVRDPNIDLALFDRVGYRDYIDIKADEPSDASDYLMNYFNMTSLDFSNDDGTRGLYYDSVVRNNPSYGNVFYSKRNSDDYYYVLDAQIHRVPIRFVGYDDTISDDYRDSIGDVVTVRADQLDLSTINDSLYVGIYARALGCNDDFSVCDVALYNYENQTIEIHKVNIVLDNTISDAFREAFNVKMDGSVDVIVDDDININWMSYYYYDGGTENSLRFEYHSGQLKLYLTNYSKKVSESHAVSFNVIGSAPSTSYQANVNSSIEVYPGENQDVWNSIRNNDYNLFSKNQSNNYNIRSISCNSANSDCSIAFFNGDRIFEVHNIGVTLKDGMSSDFSALVPDGRVSLNAIYRDDGVEYIYDAFRAYSLSKLKADAYISNCQGDSALVTLNNVESHTVSIDYAQGNPEHKAIVDDVIARFGYNSFSLDDLEYINTFYYRDPNYYGVINYNSQSVNELLTEKIANKHISYYFAGGGGMGDMFMESEGRGVLLYYDGIAYGETRYGSGVEVNMHHVIYVPNETADTTDAFVAAAQKRIDDYLGKDSGVTISLVGELSDDPASYFEQGYDLTGFDGNYYRISYMDKTEEVLILKNSSKIQSSTFNANDASSNVNVSSDNANYPTDTVVSADTVNENSNKYKELLKKLGLTIAQVIDISLYSPTIGNINDFAGVDFNVTVPIDWSKFKGRNLFAYYVADDGSIEEHPITIDDFLAKFKTNHFSTYVISEKIDSSIIDSGGSSASGEGSSASNGNNPKTFDDVMIWVAACAICAIGLASASLYLKKIKKQK